MEKQIFEYAQPHEVRTKVGAEVDSKGRVKPYAEIMVIQKLTDNTTIKQTILENIAFELAEVKKAINQMLEEGT